VGVLSHLVGCGGRVRPPYDYNHAMPLSALAQEIYRLLRTRVPKVNSDECKIRYKLLVEELPRLPVPFANLGWRDHRLDEALGDWSGPAVPIIFRLFPQSSSTIRVILSANITRWPIPALKIRKSAQYEYNRRLTKLLPACTHRSRRPGKYPQHQRICPKCLPVRNLPLCGYLLLFIADRDP